MQSKLKGKNGSKYALKRLSLSMSFNGETRPKYTIITLIQN